MSDTASIANPEPIIRIDYVSLLRRAAELERQVAARSLELQQILDDHDALPPGWERSWFGRSIDVRGAELRALMSDLAETYDELGWADAADRLRAALDDEPMEAA